MISTSINSIWFYVSLFEIGIILFVIWFGKKNGKKDINLDLLSKVIEEAKDTKINFDELVTSIHKSKKLYNELKTKYHPDRFINTNKYEKSLEIFQEITKNKTNYSELIRLQELAKNI